MSSLASRSKKKQVRKKNNSRKGKISKRDRNIINDLADKFENLFERHSQQTYKNSK